jgi:hypothetical protein
MTESREIQTVTIAGKVIPAHLCICPVCKILDLDMTVNTLNSPWTGKCSHGHTWDIDTETN